MLFCTDAARHQLQKDIACGASFLANSRQTNNVFQSIKVCLRVDHRGSTKVVSRMSMKLDASLNMILEINGVSFVATALCTSQVL